MKLAELLANGPQQASLFICKGEKHLVTVFGFRDAKEVLDASLFDKDIQRWSIDNGGLLRIRYADDSADIEQ